jgi:hypothetical protein
MPNRLKSYKCGTLIQTKISNIDAIVTCVSIRFDKITYEVSYFYDGDYKVIWLNEDEFTAKTEKQIIGFINYK